VTHGDRIACRKSISQTFVKELVDVLLARSRLRDAAEHPKQRFGFCDLVGIIAIKFSGGLLFPEPLKLLSRRALQVGHQQL
jgi:hypothetical protein